MIIPTVFLLLQNVSFEANSTAVLPCVGGVTWIHYPHMPIYEDVIYTNHSKVNSYAFDDRYVVGEAAADASADEGSITLRIRKVHKVNRGHYICIDDHDNIIKFYNVSVIDNRSTDVDVFLYKREHNKLHLPNRISVHPHIEVPEGSTINLSCSSSAATGHKIDYVYVKHYDNIIPRNNEKDLILYTEYLADFYYSDNTKVTLNQTDSTYNITIRNVNDCDSGVYECSILNTDASSDIYTVTVIPHEKAWVRKSSIDLEKARRSRVRYQTYFQQLLATNIPTGYVANSQRS